MDFIQRPLYINSCYDNGIFATSSSVVNINADAVTGATYGTSMYSYNTPTSVLANKSSTIESLRDAKIVDTTYGIMIVSNSNALIQDNIINGKAGITSSGTTISAILSQSAYVQAFDNSITGFGNLTGGTGSARYRASLQGVLIVESPTAQTQVSTGFDNSGTIAVDTFRGSTGPDRYFAGDPIDP